YAPSYRARTRDPLTRTELGSRLHAAGYEVMHLALMAQVSPAPPAGGRFRLERVGGASAWRDFEGLVRTDWADAEARTVTVVLRCDRDSHLPAYYERLGFRTVGEETVWSRPR